MNCGPPSDHNKSGTAVPQNWSLRAEISLVVVVSFPNLQSTKMRNCRPTCDAKSAAIKGCSRSGFRVMGGDVGDLNKRHYTQSVRLRSISLLSASVD